MVYTFDRTPQGIRYPVSPDDFADILTFFKDTTADVDSLFLPRAGGTLTGQVNFKNFVSTNGGSSQSASILKTAVTTGFEIFDDNIKIDGSAGRRLWIAGPNATDVAIATRSGTEKLNKAKISATTIELDGNTTINGTLNVTKQATTRAVYETSTTLTGTTNATPWAWTAFSGLGFTFVSPPSKVVSIGYGAILPIYSKQVALSYQIADGATVGSGTVRLAYQSATSYTPPLQCVVTDGGSATTGQWTSIYNAYVFTCPSAGATYNIKPYYRNLNGAGVNLTLVRQFFYVEPDL